MRVTEFWLLMDLLGDSGARGDIHRWRSKLLTLDGATLTTFDQHLAESVNAILDQFVNAPPVNVGDVDDPVGAEAIPLSSDAVEDLALAVTAAGRTAWEVTRRDGVSGVWPLAGAMELRTLLAEIYNEVEDAPWAPLSSGTTIAPGAPETKSIPWLTAYVDLEGIKGTRPWDLLKNNARAYKDKVRWLELKIAPWERDGVKLPATEHSRWWREIRGDDTSELWCWFEFTTRSTSQRRIRLGKSSDREEVHVTSQYSIDVLDVPAEDIAALARGHLLDALNSASARVKGAAVPELPLTRREQDKPRV